MKFCNIEIEEWECKVYNNVGLGVSCEIMLGPNLKASEQYYTRSNPRPNAIISPNRKRAFKLFRNTNISTRFFE